ncbi:LysR family transcriptional regulator substrate-binding protein [Lacrimispora sp.]|uniref:LysR family transcriptional regulator substrate-binding protein n=1 Tax=Lacrimispora sp. TaxID=2719234 RepID=UPI003995C627
MDGRFYIFKKETYDILNDIADSKAGSLSIGLTPERGIKMLTSVYPDFHNRLPKIVIEPQEIGVHRQQSLISKGYLDLGFVTLSYDDKTGDEYIHIYYEDILLAVPRRHPLAKNANPPDAPFAVADLRDFKDEYFVLMFKSSTMCSIIAPLFEESGFMPKLLFEAKSNWTMCNMVKNNMACSLLTFNYAQEQKEVAYFYLPQRPRWELCAPYKKAHYLTKAMRTFIALAIDHYRNTALEIGQPIL